MEYIQRRYQVFISSTFIDLIEERKQVLMALLELNCIPVGMELFPASDDDQWTYIKKVIDESDYYIVIIGGKYGSTSDDGISYTEKEYDYSISKGIPVIGFVHASPDNLPAKKFELDKDKREKLLAFTNKVQQKLCKKWTTAEELGSNVSRSLINIFSSKPAIGYIRGNFAGDPQTLMVLKNRIEELEQENSKLKYGKPEGSEELSQGNETFGIRYKFGEASYNLELAKKPFKVEWNKLISAIGPAMFDEEKQNRLKTRLEGYIADNDSLKGKYRTIIDEDFDTVISQLFGLGIIEKSQKKHTASDAGIYWSLTPYGEKCVVQLKAIKSKK